MTDKAENHESCLDASRIFTGHRALGLVSNHIPLVTRYIPKRKETLIVTVIGNSFHTYGSTKLNLLSIGRAHEDDITCLAADTYRVFTASGHIIKVWRRSTELSKEFKGHEKPIHLMLPFGQHLLAVDETNNLKVWDINAAEVSFELDFNPDTFSISAMVHPVTYLNKILFGSMQGTMQLWNLKTGKMVFAFNGWKSQITILEQAPAVDVVAVGLASGEMCLHNLKFDETLIKFKQDWGPITALTFRTDGAPIMITGSSQGHLAIWDLEQQTLVQQHRHAHRGAVTGLKSLASEPIIITSSPDNSLKMWIFDQSDGGVRLLRDRGGHKAPPIRLRFHDLLGEWILSTGLDSSLRTFSTVADLLHRNLGTAHYNQKKARRVGLEKAGPKMPPITNFASDSVRDKEWDSIAAVHRHQSEVTTWSFHRQTMGEHKLTHKRFAEDMALKKTSATCVTITACGNFAIVGYDSGHIDRYNMQSGIHRATYLRLDTEESSKLPFTRNAVRGVVSDGLNQVVLGAFTNGQLTTWNFKSVEIVRETNLNAAPSFIQINRHSGLLAIAMEDFTIIIVEVETGNIVRRLTGHDGRLTDLAFSPDARWLVSSAQDCSIRTWDLPTGTCIDYFLLPKSCVSLTFSASGSFLATAHVDDLGIYLWNNQSLYTQVSLRALEKDFEPKTAPLPGSAVKSSESEIEDSEQIEDEEEFSSPEQIADALVTLSLLPDSRWKNLLSLDAIKRRNRPKEAPKLQKLAPFFLTNTNSLPSADGQKDSGSRILNTFSSPFAMPLTPWAEKLNSAEKPEEYWAVIEELKGMGPSAIDTEIRSLSPHLGGSTHLLSQFLTSITLVLESKRNYEIVQAYLGLFLKVHGSSLSEEHELCARAEKVSGVLKDSWSTLQTNFESTLCLVSFFMNAVI
ncbi:WD repeat-containing protein 36-like [Daphnia pulex]|uniref:WD repeat-containing protein 36-like n=1 Tax=Daphnia pulex TaxID=6669 RepID=UPI001EDF8524|nr:WD repeat-containing protein 36-like [Daphnia pulex]